MASNLVHLLSTVSTGAVAFAVFMLVQNLGSRYLTLRRNRQSALAEIGKAASAVKSANLAYEEAARALLHAMSDVANAIVRVDRLLVVKRTTETGEQVRAVKLSPSERTYFEQHPELMKNADATLEWLADSHAASIFESAP